MMPSETEQAFEQILSHEVTLESIVTILKVRRHLISESYRTSALQAKYVMYKIR